MFGWAEQPADPRGAHRHCARRCYMVKYNPMSIERIGKRVANGVVSVAGSVALGLTYGGESVATAEAPAVAANRVVLESGSLVDAIQRTLVCKVGPEANREVSSTFMRLSHASGAFLEVTGASTASGKQFDASSADRVWVSNPGEGEDPSDIYVLRRTSKGWEQNGSEGVVYPGSAGSAGALVAAALAVDHVADKACA